MASLPIPTVGSVIDGYKFLGGNPNDQKNWEQVAAPMPQVGEVVSGYRFKGGNPNEQKNWEKADKKSTYLSDIPVKEEESIFRQVADVPVNIARSFVGGIEAVANIFGPDTEAAKKLKGSREYLGSLMSASAKKDEKEIARIMKEVQDKGAMDQVQGAFQILATAPVDTITSVLGSLGATALGSLAGFLIGGPPGAIVGGSAVGTAMGAGLVKGTIYEETKKALVENKIPEDKAEEIALKAQSYGGENLDMIILAGVFGLGAARTGFERDFAKRLAGQVAAKTAAKTATETATAQVAKEVPKTGVKAAAVELGKKGLAEGLPEVAQAMQEKAAENLALQRIGKEQNIEELANTPLMRGVIASGTLEPS